MICDDDNYNANIHDNDNNNDTGNGNDNNKNNNNDVLGLSKRLIAPVATNETAISTPSHYVGPSNI